MPPVGSLLRAMAHPRLLRMVGGPAGAVYGASTAEEDESRALRALGYGALGGVVAPAAIGTAARGFQAGRAAGRSGYGRALSDSTFFSFLSSPDTIARGGFGGLGGVIIGATERGIEGAITLNPDKIRQGTAVLKSVIQEGVPLAVEAGRLAIKNPEEFGRLYKRVLEIPETGPRGMSSVEQHMQGRGIGTLFAIPDMVSVQALKRGGFSAQEAARYTLTGEPQSGFFKELLAKQRDWRSRGGIREFVATQSAPFARVGLMSMEKGAQRIPVVGTLLNRRLRKSALQESTKAQLKMLQARATRQATLEKAVSGAQSRLDAAIKARKSPAILAQRQAAVAKATTKLNDAVVGGNWGTAATKAQERFRVSQQAVQAVTKTPAEQIAQQAVGAGMGALGYKTREWMDPRLEAVLGPLAGPAYLPYQAGREALAQRQRGEFRPLQLASEVFKESSPLGFNPLGWAYNPETEWARRFVPSGVSDVAKALDPAFGRETGRAPLQQATQRGEYGGPTSPFLTSTMRGIPGLRETLPETFAPVDVFGRQRYASPEALDFLSSGPLMQGFSRTFAPSLESVAPPAMNLKDPQMALLRELGISPTPPTARVTLPGTGLPLQQTAQSAATVQRYRGLPRQLAANIVAQIPALQQMPDGPQKQYLAGILMQQIQGRLTRILSAGTLPLSLSQGAQLPALFQGSGNAV